MCYTPTRETYGGRGGWLAPATKDKGVYHHIRPLCVGELSSLHVERQNASGLRTSYYRTTHATAVVASMRAYSLFQAGHEIALLSPVTTGPRTPPR